MELYRVEDLSKSYGALKVLDRLAFTIEQRECFVIMGRSGSGKSVTLRLLNGLESPDSGRILFDGKDIAGWSETQLYPVRERVAMLFQSGALFDSMNVFENIAFPLREHTELEEDAIAAKVAEKLQTVRLSGIEQKMPSDLSGGMRKRVALARSLALEPEAVLFDEPTSGLDPVTARAFDALLRFLAVELGLTIFVVTHDLDTLLGVVDRAIVLDRGTVIAQGSVQEVMRVDNAWLRSYFANHGT